jgi:hypothetical protein
MVKMCWKCSTVGIGELCGKRLHGRPGCAKKEDIEMGMVIWIELVHSGAMASICGNDDKRFVTFVSFVTGCSVQSNSVYSKILVRFCYLAWRRTDMFVGAVTWV